MFLEEVQVRSSNPPKTNTSFFILDLQLIGEGPAKAAFFFKQCQLSNFFIWWKGVYKWEKQHILDWG